MTQIFFLGFCLLQGTYFSNATTYDAEKNELRQGLHVLLDDAGRIQAVGLKPIKVPRDAERIDEALILPHYADFYTLLQERGLGMDEDISLENQQRMAETLRQLGIDRLRDPIFPSAGLSAVMKPFSVHAQRGYLALQGAQGAAYGLVVDPAAPMDQTLAELPETGPITLWWTTYGSDEELKWVNKRDWVIQFVQALHGKKRVVGAFIEGAREKHLRALVGLNMDFLEGLPDETSFLTPESFPETAWVPLLALNDKRYCAADLHKRLIPLRALQLYDSATIERARAVSRQVQASLLDRCKVWRKRRPQVLAVANRWVEGRGELAVGSAGGHPFSFTGELLPEVQMLREAGISESALLKALFETTPALLGPIDNYLAVGKPAHFIVYRNGTEGLAVLGRPVDLNFSRGRLLETELSP